MARPAGFGKHCDVQQNGPIVQYSIQ